MTPRLMRPWILGFLLASRAGAPAAAGTEPAPPVPQPVHELLQEYCVDCHDADQPKGDLDLGRFLRGADVRLEPRIWQAVAEQLAAGEMPPRDKPQPSTTGRALILGWVEDLLDRLALARSGDPGPVLLRRLSNAEYTHTLRDLTGVPSLDPAREFPVDGAAGEGFVNTGQALTMSPALLTKYLDAARDVAAHMVLLPDGIRFSEFTTRRDRSQEIIDRIREFYRRHTAPGGGSRVNLQGIVLETNAGGRLPIEQYLSALLAERATGTPLPADLSPGYLSLLRAALTDNSPSPLLGPLRERWSTATAGDIPDLVADIAAWQQALWRFQSVGHIGKVGGPRAWQEPVTPLATRQELRLQMPPADAEGAVTFHLWVGDAGDGPTGDLVRWENPRFVAPGRPDLPLRKIRTEASPDTDWGLDHGLFGRRPDGTAIPEDDLVMQGPGYLTVRVPAERVAGTEFRVTGRLDETAGSEGSVQLEVTDRPPQVGPGVQPGPAARTKAEGRWTDSPGPPVVPMPVLAAEDSAARSRFEREFQRFRDLFPAALCYERIVPVDEVVTLTLHYREDDHLRRLMLTPSGAEELDRLWEELHYVSQDALALVDAFEQLWQFATQDADPSAFEPLREPIRRRAEAFRERLRESEPRHVEAVVGFADLAWRRPLAPGERDRLRTFYHRLRGEELPHEEALRFTLVRILTAPEFLYHLEQPGPGPESVPVSDWELASRLSYFLWSGPPDGPLRQLAASGRLRQPDILAAEARRMLTDPRVRRLATEFGCAWLQIHGFDTLDEKSERHFPTFAGVRGDLYEEAILFLSDLFRSDLPVSSLLEADHSHLNDRLAGHYGIPGIEGPEWRRVDGLRSLGRGGVLGLGAVLARQSGASRTSPILRGNWLCEVLLGERLPRPPAGVPVLPEDEAETEGMTVRELVERHSRDPKCAACHVRIDPYGFALEAYDAIGRRRDRDLAGRAIDTRVRTLSGAEFEGLDGLREHLTASRMPAFATQFCRKLLGYALGRSVLISDRPLLQALRDQALSEESGVADIVETIVLSRQFREIRGRDFIPDP